MNVDPALKRYLIKSAVQETATGGPVSRGLSATAGRASQVFPQMGLPYVITGRAGLSPSLTGRAEEHKRTADEFTKVQPEALKDVKVRLGGTDVIDDVLYRKGEDAKDLPVYSKVGGRVGHNQRTSLLGKGLGYGTYPLSYASTHLFRGPHFNPFTNNVVQMWDEPSATEHELGHAIDFNSLIKSKNEEGKKVNSPDKNWAKRQAKGAVRDAYTLAYSNPIVRLWHEAQANIKSGQTMKEAFKDRLFEYKDRSARRTETLPAAYSTYVAGATGSAAPIVLPPALLGTKLGSMLIAAKKRRENNREKIKEEDKNKNKDSHQKQAVSAPGSHGRYENGKFIAPGIDEDIRRKDELYKQLLGDLRYMGLSGAPRVWSGKKWGEWDEESLKKYYAKVVDALRETGRPLSPPPEDSPKWETPYWKLYNQAKPLMKVEIPERKKK